MNKANDPNAPQKRKNKPYSRQKTDEDITICLNCTKKKCTGSCKKILASMRRADDVVDNGALRSAT